MQAKHRSFEYIIYIIVLGMLTAFGPVCTDLYLPAFPIITVQLDTTPSLVGLTLTANFLGLALGQIFIGPLSDYYGRRKPLLISLVVFIVASFLCASTNNIYLLILYRFFQGLAGAGGLVLSRSIACDRYSGSELTRFMSLLMSINSIAPIVGPLLGSFIISFASWNAIFYVLTVFGIVLYLLSYRYVEESLPDNMRQDSLSQSIKAMGHELLNRRFLYLVLSMAFIMGGFFAYLAASPFIVQKIYGFNAYDYALIFGLNSIAITLCAFISGRLSMRLGDSSLVYVSLFVLSIASLLMLSIVYFDLKDPVYMLLAMLMAVSMVGMSQSPGFSLVMQSKKGGSGAASGIFGVTIFIFGAISTSLATIMGESVLPLAIILSITTIISLVLFVMALKTGKESHIS
ncbi:multidrug effflux MFS transporter [Anaerobiospirillum thomasii]|uniref:Bcr/CflA family efflux transporter n=1 Tax=Anaerobiospirillum thomasii TaxID=179995 RepID=A0A2X0VS59_9GAMM|nr:multidrug effflux MFS transporter [Anaerobiospirillum thomasii]SPT70600.1 Sulfonamide resistance protein [Anaerobiospirillum thomasii]